MNIIADLHTHTNVHQHAFSTLEENCIAARKAGMKAIAITNHGPALGDLGTQWHFRSLGLANPGYVHGVYLISGAELNILEDGSVDIDEKYLEKLDLKIASFHSEIFLPKGKDHCTDMLNEILLNRHVNVLGHPGNELFRFDYEAIISKCNRYNKIIEVNNHSFEQRPGSHENCLEIVKLCKKYEVPIMVSSDAHLSTFIGHFEEAISVIEEAGYPEEMIINSSMDNLRQYFLDIKGIDIIKRASRWVDMYRDELE